MGTNVPISLPHVTVTQVVFALTYPDLTNHYLLFDKSQLHFTHLGKERTLGT